MPIKSVAFDLAIYLLIFGIILIIIGTFIVVQYLKVEKVARPFLLALFLYFFLMALVNLIQMYIYFVDPSPFASQGIYHNYFAVILIFFAPLALIYQIEKTYFKNKLLAKYHLATLMIIIINIVFLVQTIPSAVTDPTFIDNFVMNDYTINIVNWGIMVVAICGAFLYLGLKSSGRYRLWSFVIFFGWGGNQIINGVGQLSPYSTLVQLMTPIFIIKIAAAIVTAFGFIKLYSLRY
ncbi:MAG: hypothetical protein HWN66_11870 [Candidatus Helarchaeota archaeon]|nr:hypothetical protein [Candidatus Helarchaeota archaeon]